MNQAGFRVVMERSEDGEVVEKLAFQALGHRFSHSPAARMREGLRPIRTLSFVALLDECVIGTVRCWPVRIGQTVPAIQLGPVAIQSQHRGNGYSKILVHTVISHARTNGHTIIMLVGDPALYRQYGFVSATPHGILLPEAEDQERFQVLPLTDNALVGVSGTVGPDRTSREATMA